MRRRLGLPDADTLCRAWGVASVEVHEALPSTQDRALELARLGAPPWSAVVTLDQRAGRGRQGRPWITPAGTSLCLSLVMPSGGTPDPPLTLRVGLGVASGLQAEAGLPTQVKWPNDVWLEGGKVAGVLTERTGIHTIVGIGINALQDAADFEGDLSGRATSLAMHGWMGEAESLGRSVIAAIRDSLQSESATSLAAWAARDGLAGRDVIMPDGASGTASGIAPDGALLVHTGDGERRLVSGTVQLLRGA